MAVTNPPIALQNAGSTHTAEVLRNALSGMLVGARANSSMVPRAGVHPSIGGALAVTQQGSPAMGITVATGMCYVAGTEGTSQGAYSCYAPTTTNVAVTAAHASLSRIDLVVYRVYDSVFSGASNTSALEVIAGTPASSPSAPATPNNSLVLAQILIGPSVTTIVNANITDRRAYLGMGIVPVATFADLPSVGLHVGMQAYVRSEFTVYTWEGAAWTRPYILTKSLLEVTSTATTSAIGTTETVFTTAPSGTYKANTAYKLEFKASYVMSSATSYPYFWVRKTDAAGQTIADFYRQPTPGVASQPMGFSLYSYFTIGGSDVTATLVGVTRASSGTVTVQAGTGAARTLRIIEAGRAADYPNWPTLT